MTQRTNEQMKEIFKNRIQNLTYFMYEENLGCCVFIDNEEHRDPAVNYFSGHPSDAQRQRTGRGCPPCCAGAV